MRFDEIFIVQGRTTEAGKLIELGACLMNVKSLRAYNSINLIINPKEKLTEECMKKTGLKQEDVDQALSFSDAHDFMKQEYDIKNLPWASYSFFSFVQPPAFIDIQVMFNVMFNVQKQLSIKNALKMFDIEVSEPQDSEEEALNASILLNQIMRGPTVLKQRFSTLSPK